jgi:hypothetical protein
MRAFAMLGATRRPVELVTTSGRWQMLAREPFKEILGRASWSAHTP